MKTLLLLLPSLILCSTGIGATATDKFSRPELLVEPTELAKPDVSKSFIILDARTEKEFKQSYILGARWADHEAWSKAFENGQDKQAWSKRIGELGIRPDSKIVVYDDSKMKNAARIWWILHYWGIDDVRLLNGGWKTWNAESLPIDKNPPGAIEKAEIDLKPSSERLATKSQVLDWVNNKKVQIVDARSDKEFCGIDKQENQRAGAIPGAKHLEWSDLIDGKTDRFKSPKELRQLFEKANIQLDLPVASHCQSGGRASVMVFGLELMGAKDVRNYYRGWSEWGNATDTPIAVSDNSAEKETKKMSKTLNFTMKSLDGTDVDLSKYQGKVVMIVNVASKCGFTPQYEQLQALHERYAKEGLAILGFPCNQFLSQEPGSAEEIKEFCRINYGVTFDMFSKIELNGDGACDLYKYLTALDTKPVGSGKISWNFEKFILDRNGEVVARFAPKTKPDDPAVLNVIEKELSKK
jgi:glutathione peroxidase-family protein/3-mercaptopyruvate sulfurtransferase SseA